MPRPSACCHSSVDSCWRWDTQTGEHVNIHTQTHAPIYYRKAHFQIVCDLLKVKCHRPLPYTSIVLTLKTQLKVLPSNLTKFLPSLLFSEQISKRQSQIDRLYVSLKDLVEERKSRLEQQYWLYQLNREVDELEQWIAQREVVASSPELGQDYEHVTVSED